MESEKKFSLKKLFMRVFGKARWFLLGIGISLLCGITLILWNPDSKASEELTGKPWGEEIPFYIALEGSVNRDGDALVILRHNNDTIAAQVNIETGEQAYATLGELKRNGEYYVPSNYVMGDNHHSYGFLYEYEKETDTFLVGERLVEISEKGEYLGDICYVEYPKEEFIRESEVSKLQFRNGTLSFALVGLNGTKLYEIDAATKNVRISDIYPVDEDGTFTQSVIPLGDKYLFMQSDGKYYLTGFNEPLKDCIYNVDTNPSKRENPVFINLAAMVGDRLYVTRNANEGKIFYIEKGEMKEALNLKEAHDNDVISPVSLDAVHTGTDGEDRLAIILRDGIITYDGENVTEKEITFFIRNGWLWWIIRFLEISLIICTAGLLVNIIIRKKTLLYKQLMITIPVLLIPVSIIIYLIYSDMEDETTARTEQEIELAGRLGMEALEGYDFSGFDQMDEKTGDACIQLIRELQVFFFFLYVFWVISLSESGEVSLLARSDRIVIPGFYKDYMLSETEQEQIMDSGYSSYRDVTTLFSSDAKDSNIVNYNLIFNTKGSCRNYILKVGTDTWNFWRTRRNNFLRILWYIFLIVIALIAITVFTSWYITKTIKKATGTVHQIAGGDFSARINYRSKDELGEICTEVNTMTESLQQMFNEKDRTEKFYYKFVPEKFRELLGKEQFTDLALGDAKSRDLTILFFDIRAFSINSETMTAKENFEFVNTIYGKAGPVIREHNGFVDKYIGDAVMALFENADDAVLCGIELYRAIVLDKSTAETIGIGDVNIGIGVHSGMTRIGIVGESERLSGTVISDTVNLTSRLESLTKQYHTAMLVSKDTVDRMTDPDSFRLRYLGEVQVAGVNEVKAVYEVVDCLAEEEKEKRSGNMGEFREAVRLFHLGRRAEAAKILSDLAENGKNDIISDMYLEYIKKIPEGETRNVFRFVRK